MSHLRLKISLLLHIYLCSLFLPCTGFIHFHSPLLSKVPKTCVSPHDNITYYRSFNSNAPPVSCTLPFWRHLPNGHVQHGAKLNTPSEPILFQAGNFTVNWSFYRNTTAEQIAGNESFSNLNSLSMKPSQRLIYSRPLLRL